MAVKFIDLFAGIGGFHAAADLLGWKCVYACENDPHAAATYKLNWGIDPLADITEDANDSAMKVPPHDVLFAGFPCQPFSKSGKQLGMEETRGTLFWNILKIVESRRPKLIVLENVRNIAGPQHKHEWEVIIEQLTSLGYLVSNKPFVVSPHKIGRDFGGRPQVRERVFIVATRRADSSRKRPIVEELSLDPGVVLHDVQSWNLKTDLPLQRITKSSPTSHLTIEEIEVLRVWDELIDSLRATRADKALPGFPLWSEYWNSKKSRAEASFPDWKKEFIRKNRNFYKENSTVIDAWLARNPIFHSFSNSKKKLEWQAQDSNSLWDCLIHFRPSGIRVKKATYVPALVAITQTSIIASERRRLTVKEGARLQGLPEDFTFGKQSEAKSFKQLGNGVNVGAVYQVLRATSQRDDLVLRETSPELARSLRNAPAEFPGNN